MILAARYQTVLQLWSHFLHQAPADTYLHYNLKNKRYIGSSDRRFIRDIFYDLLRHHIRLEGILHSLATEHNLALGSSDQKFRMMFLLYLKEKHSMQELFTFFGDSPHGLDSLSYQEKALLSVMLRKPLPENLKLSLPMFWFNELKEQFPEDQFEKEVKALHQEAPLDLRINTLKTTREAVMKKLKKDGVESQATPYSPFGLRLMIKQLLTSSELILEGHVEPQDEGSQLIALLTDAKAGERVLDFCAGAGGKTLALGMMMKNKGTLIATDIVEYRLQRAAERLRRAGVHNCSVRLLDGGWIVRQEKSFDCVLVDAPCSGSGTWRRNPDMKMRVSEEDMQGILEDQKEILSKAASTVKVGGRLIYSTCSLSRKENEYQMRNFLYENPNFSVIPLPQIWKSLKENSSYKLHEAPLIEPMWTLTPFLHKTDGFFIACLKRTE